MEEVIKNYSNSMVSNSLLTKIFMKMFTGLLVTTLVAWYAYSSGMYLTMNYTVLLVVELAVVILFTFISRKLSAAIVNVLFYVYSVVNGLTMGVIFAVYDMPSISLAFAGAAVLFGGLAIYGYTTGRDLSKFGTILMWTLIAGLVVSIINLFVGNTMLDVALNWIMLFVFCGITAYDLNKIKMYESASEQVDLDKMHIYFAMELYLDFINIFLRLLSITGKRR